MACRPEAALGAIGVVTCLIFGVSPTQGRSSRMAWFMVKGGLSHEHCLLLGFPSPRVSA